MTTLKDRRGTALVVIDVQNQVMSEVHHREEVIDNIQTLLSKARQSNTPVIWVQDSGDGLIRGSDGWQIVSELTARSTEHLVHKQYPDAFEDTDLEAILSELSVGRLIISGAQTDECIRSTLHGAITRGYDTTLVSDAHTTEDFTEYGAPPPEQIITLTNLYWGAHAAPGRTAGTLTTEQVAFD